MIFTLIYILGVFQMSLLENQSDTEMIRSFLMGVSPIAVVELFKLYSYLLGVFVSFLLSRSSSPQSVEETPVSCRRVSGVLDEMETLTEGTFLEQQASISKLVGRCLDDIGRRELLKCVHPNLLLDVLIPHLHDRVTSMGVCWILSTLFIERRFAADVSSEHLQVLLVNLFQVVRNSGSSGCERRILCMAEEAIVRITECSIASSRMCVALLEILPIFPEYMKEIQECLDRILILPPDKASFSQV